MAITATKQSHYDYEKVIKLFNALARNAENNNTVRTANGVFPEAKIMANAVSELHNLITHDVANLAAKSFGKFLGETKDSAPTDSNTPTAPTA